jgi:glutaredoxin
MKKNIIIIIFLVIILIIGIYYTTEAKKRNDQKLLASVQDKLIFFYGDGCPHCVNVEKFFQDNNVESKVQFEKKETFNDTRNSSLMSLIAEKKCSISGNELGVPLLWDGQNSKCLLGDQDIINFFKQKLGI